jgi:hypothetical protein
MFATIKLKETFMQILELSQQQIENNIFKGAQNLEQRSPLAAFTEEEILVLPRHANWNTFDLEFREWIWDTINMILDLTDDDL